MHVIGIGPASGLLVPEIDRDGRTRAYGCIEIALSVAGEASAR